MKTAIVTDGLWRKSLSAIRSLGKAGFQVEVLGDSWFTTGFWSSFTASRTRAQVAATDPEKFGLALLKALKRYPPNRKPVLLPMEDPTLMWVDAHREQIQALCYFLIPDSRALAISQDKGRTLEVAREAGLPVPATFEPETAEEFADLALARDPGAFVVKPRSGTGSAGISYGDSRSREEWIAHWNFHGRMLIQERVPAHGKGQGVSLLMDSSGECVAAFVHERLQQYPNSGGPSTDRHGIHAPELVKMSIALLKKLNWKGIAMVEWKLDPSDQNRPKLMEINPRFWGSLELAVRSGVDFPALYAAAARGEKLGPPPKYVPSRRVRWLIPGDILRYLTQEKSQRESLAAFVSGMPGSLEEWDLRDLKGTLSTIVCAAAMALNPRFWKYLRRG